MRVIKTPDEVQVRPLLNPTDCYFLRPSSSTIFR